MRILFFLVIFSNLIYAQTVERVEPSNWWAGMEYNELSLLVYGNNLQGYEARTDYSGLTIKKTIQVENPNYVFIDLRFDENIKAGKAIIELKKGSKKVSIDFPILERERNSANRKGFDSADAIYLVQVDRFANGDTSNDSTSDTKEKANREFKGGRHGGDIQGLINNLDYIDDMGFTFIWPCPMIENDMPEYSYHGYATTDYYSIDSRFGTNEDFKRLVNEAEKRGIGVIKDVVLNHVGSEHWFIKDLPTKDWVNDIKPGEYVGTNHVKYTQYDPYASEMDKNEYKGGWFVSTMPDLNQKNKLLADYLIQQAIWWIEFSGVRGFRVDTWSYSDQAFLNRWAKAIMTEYPRFNIVAEEWTSTLPLTSYWQKGKVNHDGFQSELPTVMDFALGEKIKETLTKDEEHTAWKEVYENMALDFLFPEPMELLIFPDNHDMDRVYTALKEDFSNWKLMMTLFATMRGIPQVYYGTEILMTNENEGDHGEIRADFPGGWSGDSVNAFTGEGLTPQQKEAQKLVKKLFNYRKNSAAIKNGKLKHFVPKSKEDTYVYFRFNDDEKIMVCLNASNENVLLDLNRFTEIIPANLKAKEVISGEEMNVSKTLEIPAKTAWVLEIK